jgi:hypothetical protein
MSEKVIEVLNYLGLVHRRHVGAVRRKDGVGERVEDSGFSPSQYLQPTNCAVARNELLQTGTIEIPDKRCRGAEMANVVDDGAG